MENIQNLMMVKIMQENKEMKMLADMIIELQEIKQELRKKLKPVFPEGSGMKSETIAYRETGEGIFICNTKLYKYLLKRAHLYDNISRSGKGIMDKDIHGDQCFLFGNDMLGFWMKVHPDYNPETEQFEKVNIDEILEETII